MPSRWSLRLLSLVAVVACVSPPGRPSPPIARPPARPIAAPPTDTPSARAMPCTPALGDGVALPESIAIERQLPSCPPRPRRTGRPMVICIEDLHGGGPHVLERLFRDGRREPIEEGRDHPFAHLAAGLADGRLRYIRAQFAGRELAGDVVTRSATETTTEVGHFGRLDFETIVGLSPDRLEIAFLERREGATEGGPWDVVIQDVLRGERARLPIGAEQWVAGLHFFGGPAPARVLFDGTRLALARDGEHGTVVIERHDLGRAPDATLLDRRSTEGTVVAMSSNLGTVLLARPRVGPSGTFDFLAWRLDEAAAPIHLPIDAGTAALDRCGTQVVVQAKIQDGPPLFAHVNFLPYEVGRVPLAEERYVQLFQTTCPAAVAITDAGLVTATCWPENDHTPGTLWVGRLAGGEVRTFTLPPDGVGATLVPGW